MTEKEKYIAQMQKAENSTRNGNTDIGVFRAWFGVMQELGKTDLDLSLEWNAKLRTALQKAARVVAEPQEYVELLYFSYVYSAPYVFDDYCIALEWKREPERKFWLPRRKVLLPIVRKIEDLLVWDKLDLLTISMPPGTGKSALKNFIFSWVCGKDPEKPNLDSGHSGNMTQSTYDGVLEIMTDTGEYNWADIFPNAGKIITNAKELTIDVGKKHRFSTLTCRAIGASLTGATRCEGLLTADDLVSGIEEALSKERLEKKWEAYSNDLRTRKKLTAKELHIATRWSVHDPIGHLQRLYANDPRAEFITVPALNDKGESNVEYDHNVGFDPKYFLDMQKTMDDMSFKALFMNQPLEREGLLYPEDSLTTYYELPPEEPDAILAVCDTAEGGGDDTVMVICNVYGQKHYLTDVVCSSDLPEVTDGLCVDALIRNKVQKCQFESNSAGGRTADKISETLRSRNCHCSITKKRTTANKETKIIVNSDFVKKNILFKDRKVVTKGSMYNDFLNKVTSYTVMGKNKHDDTVDALAMYALFTQQIVGNTIEILPRPF